MKKTALIIYPFNLKTEDTPGVIGCIGSVFGENSVSIQSIVQFDANEADAEIQSLQKEKESLQGN